MFIQFIFCFCLILYISWLCCVSEKDFHSIQDLLKLPMMIVNMHHLFANSGISGTIELRGADTFSYLKAQYATFS